MPRLRVTFFANSFRRLLRIAALLLLLLGGILLGSVLPGEEASNIKSVQAVAR